jgi:SAM-dependent methyltransferase
LRLGYDEREWLRVRQIEAFTEFISVTNPTTALEVSPGHNSRWRALISNYRSVEYPGFDICLDRLPEQFNIVIADQVLEHVPAPLAAVENLRAMTAPGGHVMIAAPFLFRVHGRPKDYTRWTPEGLEELLKRAGFPKPDIQIGSWGNKACARAHIGGRIRMTGFGRDMSNDHEYPVMVWAIAKVSRSVDEII